MPLRLHPVTIGFVILLCGALAFVNLNPRLQWWHLSWYCSWDPYEHGWPFTYMSRERNRDGDMGGLAYGPWPFFDDPPLRQFSPMWLVVDLVVALCLLALTSRAVESWFGVRQVRLQFRLASLLKVIALACVLLALIRVLEGYIGWTDLAGIALGLAPNALVFISACLSSVFLVKLTRAFIVRLCNGKNPAE